MYVLWKLFCTLTCSVLCFPDPLRCAPRCQVDMRTFTQSMAAGYGEQLVEGTADASRECRMSLPYVC